ncbi:MAG: hypothetical protein N2749_05285 [Clostridia bacterium]|nr:hypothetical protein [Clostridia bacterium]
MDDFIVQLSIVDTCCNKCFKEVNRKMVTITETSQTVALQNCFTLNVINVEENFATVLIQNGVYAIIRNIFTNYTTEICLPNKCKEHIVAISVNIEED